MMAFIGMCLYINKLKSVQARELEINKILLNLRPLKSKILKYLINPLINLKHKKSDRKCKSSLLSTQNLIANKNLFSS